MTPDKKEHPFDTFKNAVRDAEKSGLRGDDACFAALFKTMAEHMGHLDD